MTEMLTYGHPVTEVLIDGVIADCRPVTKVLVDGVTADWPSSDWCVDWRRHSWLAVQWLKCWLTASQLTAVQWLMCWLTASQLTGRPVTEVLIDGVTTDWPSSNWCADCDVIADWPSSDWSVDWRRHSWLPVLWLKYWLTASQLTAPPVTDVCWRRHSWLAVLWLMCWLTASQLTGRPVTDVLTDGVTGDWPSCDWCADWRRHSWLAFLWLMCWLTALQLIGHDAVEGKSVCDGMAISESCGCY